MESHERQPVHSTIVKVQNVGPSVQRWLSELFGVDLTDSDAVTVALHSRSAVDGEDRRAAARKRLLLFFAELDKRRCSTPDSAEPSDQEIDAAIEEAMAHVRRRQPSRPAQSLEDWTKIYGGLNDPEIESIDRIAKTRSQPPPGGP